MDEVAAIRKAVVELKVKALRAEGGDRTEQDRESDEIRRKAARLLSRYDDKMTESDYYYSEILAPGGAFIPDYFFVTRLRSTLEALLRNRPPDNSSLALSSNTNISSPLLGNNIAGTSFSSPSQTQSQRWNKDTKPGLRDYSRHTFQTNTSPKDTDKLLLKTEKESAGLEGKHKTLSSKLNSTLTNLRRAQASSRLEYDSKREDMRKKKEENEMERVVELRKRELLSINNTIDEKNEILNKLQKECANVDKQIQELSNTPINVEEPVYLQQLKTRVARLIDSINIKGDQVSICQSTLVQLDGIMRNVSDEAEKRAWDIESKKAKEEIEYIKAQSSISNNKDNNNTQQSIPYDRDVIKEPIKRNNTQYIPTDSYTFQEEPKKNVGFRDENIIINIDENNILNHQRKQNTQQPYEKTYHNDTDGKHLSPTTKQKPQGIVTIDDLLAKYNRIQEKEDTGASAFLDNEWDDGRGSVTPPRRLRGGV